MLPHHIPNDHNHYLKENISNDKHHAKMQNKFICTIKLTNRQAVKMMHMTSKSIC